MSEANEFRYLVRIADKDMAGNKKLIAGLAEVHGIGHNLASALITKLSMDPNTRIGALTEEQVKQIEKTIQSASTLLPAWYMNRRRDLESGETKHLLGADLDFAQKNDIDQEMDIRSWKGVRHSLGLKVRGQRTRTTGRKGSTVGVRKATLIAAAKEAAQKKEEK